MKAYAEKPQKPKYIYIEMGGDAFHSPTTYRLLAHDAKKLANEILSAVSEVTRLNNKSE